MPPVMVHALLSASEFVKHMYLYQPALNMLRLYTPPNGDQGTEGIIHVYHKMQLKKVTNRSRMQTTYIHQ